MKNKKTVVVGITGGIAAFKSCELISLLIKAGYNVEVIMTKNAEQFITPLTLQTLSKNLVHRDMFAEPKKWDVEHIELAKRADLMLIVPASANIIGKVANGIADDMLSTVIMATKAQVIFAPAMNTNMYENPIVQNNIEKLKNYGYLFIEPAEGLLACNDVGKGKLESPEKIFEIADNILNTDDSLKGKKILITAGPTREAIDPVRYITNRSTGTMGYSIAKAAVQMGAKVYLISGKTNLKIPYGLEEFISVESAENMYNEVEARVSDMDIVIKSAAVADYTPEEYSEQKVKKSDKDMAIKLKRTKDIAYEIGKNKKQNQVFIGFAAETQNVIENATAKAVKKNFDFVVANDVTAKGAGFGGSTNIVSIIEKNGTCETYPIMDKLEIGKLIMKKAKDILESK